MLNTIIFNVLNKVLDGNIESVDYYFSEGHKLQITTKNKLLYADFVKKTKRIISEIDIGGSYDEDEEDLYISIDLTEEFVNKIIAYVKYECLSEFEEMRRLDR